jgi:hypothetical protein
LKSWIRPWCILLIQRLRLHRVAVWEHSAYSLYKG